jgi:Zn-dependent alcohol dehydrogenase
MLDGTTRLSQNGLPVFHFSALACFADYAVVPEQCCVVLPKSVVWESAAVIGCAVTTGVGAVFNTARVEAGASVAVFGVGGVGLSIVMGAAAAGASTIVAVDPHPTRLAKALELGATQVCQSNPIDTIRSLTGGRGADYVFEAVGDPSVQELCLEAARPGGVVVLSGIAPMGSGTNFPGAILTRQEKTVMGSYYGTSDPARDFPLYAQMMADGRLPLEKLVTKRYKLEQINEAYEDMLAGRTARGVVVF